MSNAVPLLHIQNLHVTIGDQKRHAKTSVHAVRGVTIVIEEGARLGIIGESGSGKTMTALAALGLLPPTATRTADAISYRGQDLLTWNEKQLRAIRGKEISMVFQNAHASLNPLIPIGRQIADVYHYHEGGSTKEAWAKAVAILDAMGIPDAERRAHAYPHQLSGGMAQRAMIGMGLVCSPQLLIADEPTSGLDLTIQAQVLSLLHEHVQRQAASLLLISHDLAVIANICTHVAVMYAGAVVETGTLEQIFSKPAHPYTRALIACYQADKPGKLAFIPGRVPDLRQELEPCAFAPRCPQVQSLCRTRVPEPKTVAENHLAACHFA